MKNKPVNRGPDYRQEKLDEHNNLNTRKVIRDKRYYVIDDEDEIDRILNDEEDLYSDTE